MWAWAETPLLTVFVTLVRISNNSLWEREKLSSCTPLLCMRAPTLLILPSCQFSSVRVDSSLCVTEEFFGLHSMHGTTTGKDLFEEVSRCVDKMGLPWDKLVGLTTDGAPAMCGRKSGLVGRIREKMQDENVTSELTSYHCIIHQESLCGKALKMEHVMSIITRAVNLYQSQRFKSPPVQVLSGGVKFGLWWLALSHRGAMAKPGKGAGKIFRVAWGDMWVHGKQRERHIRAPK